MNKKCYRFFGGLIALQEKWLNKMAEKGYRLIRTEKMLYEFKECTPKSVRYCVDFIGEKSQGNAQDYFDFLKDMGYTVFFKNINLNYSIGKAKYRPWAKKGGRIATNATTYNRELLIVEKERDGNPFQLHTCLEDKIVHYSNVRKPWVSIFALVLLLGICLKSAALGAFAIIPMIPIIVYQSQIAKLKKESQIKEW